LNDGVSSQRIASVPCGGRIEARVPEGRSTDCTENPGRLRDRDSQAIRFNQNAQTFTIRQRKPRGVGTRRLCKQLGGATKIGAGAKKTWR